MKLKINNNQHSFSEEKLSIKEILNKLNYTFPDIIIKFKSKIINEKDFEETFLTDNDEILIIHTMAGG
jgi:thiamine biosynthesis protein ThiS